MHSRRYNDYASNSQLSRMISLSLSLFPPSDPDVGASLGSLYCLPREILLHLASFLPSKHIGLHLALVNKYFYMLTLDEALYKDLCMTSTELGAGVPFLLTLMPENSIHQKRQDMTWREWYRWNTESFHDSVLLTPSFKRNLLEWYRLNEIEYASSPDENSHSNCNNKLGYNKRWRLHYRASRDGYTAKAFHQKVDFIGEFYCVIKSHNGFIFGGYSSITWTSRGDIYLPDSKCFVFSLTNPSNTGPVRITATSKERRVVSDNGERGPLWGQGYDLCIYDNFDTQRCYTNLGVSFDSMNTGIGNRSMREFLTGHSSFTVSEMEVFIPSHHSLVRYSYKQ
eukprot:GEZU01025282.1.p1 GENE.GEZU01025282.1~~GEZU01025282.1.p1  ORF type:complete len:339 (-),score=64.63 GEZU01025282.1:184-1200(-)